MNLETLDVKEVYDMLKDNQIDIPESALQHLFSIVHPKKNKELCLDEFIKFSFDKVAHMSKIPLQVINSFLEFRRLI